MNICDDERARPDAHWVRQGLSNLDVWIMQIAVRNENLERKWRNIQFDRPLVVRVHGHFCADSMIIDVSEEDLGYVMRRKRPSISTTTRQVVRCASSSANSSHKIREGPEMRIYVTV